MGPAGPGASRASPAEGRRGAAAASRLPPPAAPPLTKCAPGTDKIRRFREHVQSFTNCQISDTETKLAIDSWSKFRVNLVVYLWRNLGIVAPDVWKFRPC